MNKNNYKKKEKRKKIMIFFSQKIKNKQAINKGKKENQEGKKKSK